MGFLKDFGKAVGVLGGAVIGGTIEMVGEATNNNFVKDVAHGVYHVTANTGEMLGSLAEGAVNCATGIITSDNQLTQEGFDEVVETAVTTAKNIGNGMVKTVGTGFEVAEAVVDGDAEKAINAGKTLVKVAVVGALSIGICDVVDGAVGEFDEFDDYEVVDNPNMHHVSPHYRTLPDGREIWVDGDGDTSVDTFDGWMQHNPDTHV